MKKMLLALMAVFFIVGATRVLASNESGSADENYAGFQNKESAPVEVAPARPTSVEGRIDLILDNQARILNKINEMQKQLDIIRVRCSRT